MDDELKKRIEEEIKKRLQEEIQILKAKMKQYTEIKKGYNNGTIND